MDNSTTGNKSAAPVDAFDAEAAEAAASRDVRAAQPAASRGHKMLFRRQQADAGVSRKGGCKMLFRCNGRGLGKQLLDNMHSFQ